MVYPTNIPYIITYKIIGNTDEVVIILDAKVSVDVSDSNENKIKGEVNMVGTKEEVEHICTEAEEVMEPVNLPPIMTDGSMGSVDEIGVLSDVKVSESVLGINRNEVNKEVNRWVYTKEWVNKI